MAANKSVEFHVLDIEEIKSKSPLSSLSDVAGLGFIPVCKLVVGSQWYKNNPELQKYEIRAMNDICPNARWGYLDNGNMYWTFRLRPVICGVRKDWTLLAVYDSDHPQQRWAGSVKFYPVSPNFAEMLRMVVNSPVQPKGIPHTLQDSDGQIYLCTQHMDNIHAGSGGITTAATCLRFAMRWINVFELGLIDQETWNLFHKHGEI